MNVKTGLVLGKFYPPHAGHYHLINTAIAKVDHLTIVVCSKKGEAPAAPLRARWLRELYPQADVLVMESDGLPDNDSSLWAEVSTRTLGFTPTVVFTSEPYGEPWAKAMGCQHVFVGRGGSGLSGTAVRADPLNHFNDLAKSVQAYYVKRICLIGTDSTGKTSLAQALAQHYHTFYVPEYGRYYTVEKLTRGDREWRSDEFMVIAKRQAELEDKAARSGDKLLICDTDVLDTAIWHERFMKRSHPEVQAMADARHYDLYVLTTTADTPFVQDGTRDQDNLREWMEQRIIEELQKQGREYITVSGSLEQRLAVVVREIDRRWPQVRSVAA